MWDQGPAGTCVAVVEGDWAAGATDLWGHERVEKRRKKGKKCFLPLGIEPGTCGLARWARATGLRGGLVIGKDSSRF